jgi:glycosyltransferase involved in cell wall biosynthesis
MRVLFDCGVPFFLAHGGQQIQIQQTQAALEKIGVTVEPLRWWDEHQSGEILHYFGRVPIYLLQLAKRKGMRVVSSALEGGLGAKSPLYKLVLRTARRALSRAAPGADQALTWDCFRLSDASIALTAWEAHLLQELFHVRPTSLYRIPNGVEEVFLSSQPQERGPWLVCTATIIELKQVLKLAQAAVLAQTPLWIIGRPYSEDDEYFKAFCGFVKQHSNGIRYEGPVTDRLKLAQVYRQARGFVLLSKWESLSLSALEASACGCPLFLSDLPWARWHFEDNASYCPSRVSAATIAPTLRAFYERAPGLPSPPRPLSWIEVANRLKQVYEKVLKSSR